MSSKKSHFLSSKNHAFCRSEMTTFCHAKMTRNVINKKILLVMSHIMISCDELRSEEMSRGVIIERCVSLVMSNITYAQVLSLGLRGCQRSIPSSYRSSKGVKVARK